MLMEDTSDLDRLEPRLAWVVMPLKKYWKRSKTRRDSKLVTLLYFILLYDYVKTLEKNYFYLSYIINYRLSLLPKDAEQLARYQIYARNTMKVRLNEQLVKQNEEDLGINN